MRFTVSFLLIFSFLQVFGQQKKGINGKILEKIKYGDSILFFHEFDIDGYYDTKGLSSTIQNNTFLIKKRPKYPQMFRMRLKSEVDIIPYRNGYYFLDSTTTTITIDDGKLNPKITGLTSNEFNNFFIPFFERNGVSEEKLEYFLIREKIKLDPILFSYVKQNPESYVALWFLFSRFNHQGYSDLRNSILESFSISIKKTRLWIAINNEFKAITIKQKIPFPNWELKDMRLKDVIFKIPKTKFTLIDFWFARCRPCLDQIPELKDIYTKHKDNLSILAISTDKTKDLALLKERVKEYQIPWENYIDENGKNAFREKILSFPTNFLLDMEGNVIMKNVSLKELKIILNSTILDSPIPFSIYQANPF